MKSKWRLLLLILLSCTVAAAQQYAPALPGYQFVFPRDHFDHPAYQTEWWYYTGNLRAKNGHRFGFELTFFRQGVDPTAPQFPWNVRDLYMAHLALSDISDSHYESVERLNRAGPGIAGADEAMQMVWNGNWQTRITPSVHTLRGVAENFSFELRAVPEKEPVIQGENGVSQKAAGVGHASHYVSFTRMRTSGSLIVDGKSFSVDGDTWMDHEFFSDSISNEVGWDWLSIQLNDKSELMLYRLRHPDGSVDPYSSGTYIDPQGRAQHLRLEDFKISPETTTWKSQKTGAVYPLAWSVSIPKLDLSLAITTPLQNQEFVSRFGPSYWEGAVDINGQKAGQTVAGSGYLEMTGYSHAQPPLFGASSR